MGHFLKSTFDMGIYYRGDMGHWRFSARGQCHLLSGKPTVRCDGFRWLLTAFNMYI